MAPIAIRAASAEEPPIAIALVIVLASIAAGAAIGLAPGGGHQRLGALRTFAFVAAAVVVFAQLLPEALTEIGLPALVVFGTALAVPTLMERIAHARHRRRGAHHHQGEHADDHAAGLELGYLGLVVHSLGDGLGVGAFADPLHGAGAALGVALSVAAHTVPVTALFVVAFAGQRGVRSALLRAAGLGAAIAAGMAVAGSVPSEAARPFQPWVSAAVAGLLLHVIAHDWPAEPSRSVGQRWLELLAIAAGLALILLSGHQDFHATHAHGHGELGGVLLELALETAPMLLLGLLVGAVLQTFGAHVPAAWLHARSRLGAALRGALLGAPLPVCACGVLPIATAFHRRGLAPAFVVAFLLATPELGVESLALSVQFLGWPLAIVRLLAAPLAAIAAAVALGRIAARPSSVASAAGATRDAIADAPAMLATLADADDGRPWARRVVHHFDELLFHLGAWTLVGLLAAAYVEIALRPEALASLARHGLDVIVVSLAAVPSYVCAASATPLAAVLIEKGLSPGAALAGLLLGPATNVATVGFLVRAYGRRAAAGGVLSLVAVAWIVAFALNATGVTPPLDRAAREAHAHGVLSYAALALLVACVARGIWSSGLRVWLGSLGEAFSAPTAGARTAALADADAAHAHRAHAGHRHEAPGVGAPLPR